MRDANFRKSTNIEDRRGKVKDRAASWYDVPQEELKTGGKTLDRLPGGDDAGDGSSTATAVPGDDEQQRSPSQGHTNARIDDAVIGRRRKKLTEQEKADQRMTQKIGNEQLSDLSDQLDDPEAKKRAERRNRWYGESEGDEDESDNDTQTEE